MYKCLRKWVNMRKEGKKLKEIISKIRNFILIYSRRHLEIKLDA